MTPSCRPPPRHLAELRVRADALAGRSLGELARALGFSLDGEARRTKGRAGELLERALGATAGSTAQPDFPALGVELKSIPVDEAGSPRESTFVAAISFAEAAAARWETSTVRSKMDHVLWIPIVTTSTETPWSLRRIGTPVFWRSTLEQQAILRADFDELMGRIGAGDVERLSAHSGRWLQVRPKAAHGRVRALAPFSDGEPVIAQPRGFYLRTRFTGAILRDPAALPD